MTERVIEPGAEFGREIRVLTPCDVGSLRLPWDSRFSQEDLRAISANGPELSVWNSRTGEFLVGGAWRHRREISTVVELAATGGAIDLMRAFAAASRAAGMRMAVASEQAERRRSEFYEAAGFEPIEEIIVYKLGRVRPEPPATAGLRFELFSPSDRQSFDEILSLDHQTFPWLWWNSEEEFYQYAHSPGVRIEVGRDYSGRAVAYLGVTRYRSWGHLDRIAIARDMQGRGLGRAALDYCVMMLAQLGARRVGLSTQARNTRSRRLYETYGFRRSPTHDYRLYGRRLDAELMMHESEQG